ncbi:MAG: T9SS type A sorting domain-containing protein [Bacteroidetes bacterium]|nr:T9SS type A sorting domain-containing protein [Bacteroidota bacterium]
MRTGFVLIMVAICLLQQSSLVSQQRFPDQPFEFWFGEDVRLAGSMLAPLGTDPFNSASTTSLRYPGWSEDGRSRIVTSGATVLIGTVRGELRASGSLDIPVHRPGPVLTDGSPAPMDDRWRVYHISIDDKPGSPAWDAWPSDLGAPTDAAGNPLLLGDRQAWWVMNDMDTTSMRRAANSTPMGLEVQMLVWEARVRNAVCFRVTYINKSGDSITSAYVAHAVLPFLRGYATSLAGSDPAREMAYAYEKSDYDPRQAPPFSMGACLLQTPRVPGSGSDSARWQDGYMAGYRNAALSGTVMPTQIWSSPHALRRPMLDSADAPERWLAFARGRTMDGAALDPHSGAEHRFWFDGNPVNGSGWLQEDGFRSTGGLDIPAASHWWAGMVLASGPFDLAPGDTQQVAFAWFFNTAATPTSGVHMLRAHAEAVRDAYRDPARACMSGAHIVGYLPDSAIVRAWTSTADSTRRITAAGYRNGVKVIGDIPLLKTSRASSGDWGYFAEFACARTEPGIDVFLTAHDTQGSVLLPGASSLPLTGDLAFNGVQVLEDEDGDGRIARDETVRLFPRLHYRGRLRLRELLVMSRFGGTRLSVSDLPPESWYPGEHSHGAQGWSPASGYLAYPARSVSWGSSFDLVSREHNMLWQSDLVIRRDSIDRKESWTALMEHVHGPSTQRVGVRILDPDALQNRWYVATLRGDSIPATPFSPVRHAAVIDVQDSTSAALLVRGYGLQHFVAPMNTLDGLRFTKGTAFLSPVPGWQVAPGLGTWGYSTDSHMENPHHGFISTMYIYPQGTEVTDTQEYPDLRLLVGGPWTQRAYYYVDSRYAGRIDVPLICEATHRDGHRRLLDVVLFERGDEQDNGWNIDGINTLLVLRSDYSPADRTENTTLPLPANFLVPVLSDDSRLFAGFRMITDSRVLGSPDTVNITLYHEVSPDDRYRYNPFAMVASRTDAIPENLHIGTPYPNPSDDWVRIPLELPDGTTVRAALYDMLGRQVRSIWTGMLPAGSHLLSWDGRDASGNPVAAGMYFFRVTAAHTSGISRVLYLH